MAAIVLTDGGPGVPRERLGKLLDFFGIPWQLHADPLDPPPQLARSRYAVFAPIPALAEAMRRGAGPSEQLPALWQGAAAIYLYATDSPTTTSAALQLISGGVSFRVVALGSSELAVQISKVRPELAGPLSGLTAHLRPNPRDQACEIDDATGSVERILDSRRGALLFVLQRHGRQIFVSASRDVPDLEAPIGGRWFDVRDDFGSCVPPVMFLKWAFRGVGWQPRESGACLIIDDPLLKHHYGFLDFGRLERLMRERHFTTNVAFIPWNYRRTSAAVARMMVASEGRFSISIHGCDHTGAEFGVRSVSVLNGKASLIRERMDEHARRTGVPHDWIRVFPQGVFSKVSLRALQQRQFLAAVNTDVLPVDTDERPTLADLWSPALLNHFSFPLFTRRYPDLGIENFAFDVLLGKPCLIVEHHTFFKDGGTRAAAFIDALNALNARLDWQPLGAVIRRAYQWRVATSSQDLYVRMFANELALKNEQGSDRTYVIEKGDRGSAGVQAVLTDRGPVAWTRQAERIIATVPLRAGEETTVRVLYTSPPGVTEFGSSPREALRTAARRYGSEFRDDVLSRYERLDTLAALARGVFKRR